MRFFKIYYISFILIFFLNISASAQSQAYSEDKVGFFSNWMINLNLGSNLFYGDIQQYKFAPYKEDWRMAGGLILRKQISPVFGIGGQLLNGKLHGTKKKFSDGAPANLKFNADILEYNLHTTLNFSNLIWGYNNYRRLSIYGLIGIGFANWNSELLDYNTDKILGKSGIPGGGFQNRTTELVLPMGLGLNFNLSNNWGINLESTLRGVNSDMLDAQKGGFKYDIYNYTSFGISYSFNGLGIGTGRSSYERNQYRQERRNEKLAQKDLKYYSHQNVERTRKYNKQERQMEKQEREEVMLKMQKERTRSDLPDIIEYDAIDIFSAKKPVRTSRGTITSTDTYAPETRTVIDEGKFIITGGHPTTDRTTETGNIYTPQTSSSTESGNVYTPQTSYDNIQTTKISAREQGLVYRIQIMAKHQKRANMQQFANYYNITDNIFENYHDGWYRYSVGSFTNFNDASNYCKVIKNKGITDAFVVVYKNGVRIPLSEALK
jgi:opacity protein-like surface antigen